MRVKVRTLLYPVRDRYAYPWRFEEFEIYEGELVDNPPWLSTDYISMTTGIPHFPIRSFAKDRIVQEDKKMPKREPAKPRARTYKVPSSSGQGHYIVTVDNDMWSCTCPGYEFRQHCKHIVATQNKRRNK
jgi:hypothetical protein